MSLDANVGMALGSPLKAWGTGGSSGRRHAIERWELEEDGEAVTVIRFNVAGPQGTGRVVVQVRDLQPVPASLVRRLSETRDLQGEIRMLLPRLAHTISSLDHPNLIGPTESQARAVPLHHV